MQAPGGQHRYGGAGLGLMLSKRLAQGLGGDLSLRASSPGQGSTFRVAIAAPPPPAPPASAATAAPRPLAGRQVLVADDNADISFAIVRLLELQGARVVLATDGQEAIDKAKSERFDAIIMDVRMPGIDGLEATRRLRLAGHRMPILALTADAVPEQRAECLAAGCDDYLSKPFDPDKLIETIVSHIQ